MGSRAVVSRMRSQGPRGDDMRFITIPELMDIFDFEIVLKVYRLALLGRNGSAFIHELVCLCWSRIREL